MKKYLIKIYFHKKVSDLKLETNESKISKSIAKILKNKGNE